MSARIPRKWPALLAGVVLLVVALGIAQEELRPKPSVARPAPRTSDYATQGSSLRAVHRAYVRWGSADLRDRFGAACEAHSVAGWAKHLGTAQTPQAVARALAATVEPAFRRAAYLGCLDQLQE